MTKKIQFLSVAVGLMVNVSLYAKDERLSFVFKKAIVQQDTLIVKRDSVKKESTDIKNASFANKKIKAKKSGNILDLKSVSKAPFISVQQLLKGNVSGLNVQENNGEPGTKQNMVVRGLTSPLFSDKDISKVQPAVFVNGIPLISDHPYAYNVQQYDFNRIGPNSNLLAGININSIESIEVVKDPNELAKLGPLAVNGAILINLKEAKGTQYTDLNIDTYIGYAQSKNPNTTNGFYERDFRNQFYDAYNIPHNQRTYPDYLKDTSNETYFGSSKWSDSYYKAAPFYNFNFSLGAGSDKANFRLALGRTTDASGMENTSYSKNNVDFFVNMKPFERFKFSAMISGARAGRERNRNLRDRYAETQYLPDLSAPISPNKDLYDLFLSEYGKSIDDNLNQIVRGYIAGDLSIAKGMSFSSKLAFDYNEGVRDLFLPSTLMDGVNYISNYFDYNQRFFWNNNFNYKFSINDVHNFSIEASGSVQSDSYRYNYAKAYNGPNDYIKSTSNSSDFSNYRYTDRQKMKMLSSVISLGYNYKELFKAGAVIRYDGSSNFQPDSRWILGYSGFLESTILKGINGGSTVNARLSYSHVGKLITSDRISAGPQYTVDFGWGTAPNIPSYNGVSGISRPYTSGWVGYNIGWPYSNKIDFTLSGEFFQNKLAAVVSFYNNQDHNMLIPVNVPAEYGFTNQTKGGMDILNTGVNLSVQADLISKTKNRNFGWNTSFNMGYNYNELLALPDGRSSLIIGDRKLEVGQSIDKFWVYKNEGVYNGSGSLTVDGVQLHQGDAAWVDLNGDGTINYNDKVLKGNSMPVVTGGLSNTFTYKNWDLSFNMYFALGHEAINERDAQRYDFVNTDTQNSINSVSEIFFWQMNDNAKSYPLYNPLSTINNYRKDQDLFLESLDFLKLRSLTVGYNFELDSAKKVRHGNKRNAYVYMSGTNLFTLTKFSGEDPELVNFNGYYSGYAQPFYSSVSLGMKLNF